MSFAPVGDGGLQVHVREGVGGSVVSSELLLSLWERGVDNGSGRELAL